MDTNYGDSIPIHNVEEMKSTVLQYSSINNELKHLQQQTKSLKEKRSVLSEKMKGFMRFNQLELCHISENVNTNIRKIRYVHRDKKQRVTLKMVEEYFEEFFESIDLDKFFSTREQTEIGSFLRFHGKKTSVYDTGLYLDQMRVIH